MFFVFLTLLGSVSALDGVHSVQRQDYNPWNGGDLAAAPYPAYSGPPSTGVYRVSRQEFPGAHRPHPHPHPYYQAPPLSEYWYPQINSYYHQPHEMSPTFSVPMSSSAFVPKLFVPAAEQVFNTPRTPVKTDSRQLTVWPVLSYPSEVTTRDDESVLSATRRSSMDEGEPLAPLSDTSKRTTKPTNEYFSYNDDVEINPEQADLLAFRKPFYAGAETHHQESDVRLRRFVPHSTNVDLPSDRLVGDLDEILAQPDPPSATASDLVDDKIDPSVLEFFASRSLYLSPNRQKKLQVAQDQSTHSSLHFLEDNEVTDHEDVTRTPSTTPSIVTERTTSVAADNEVSKPAPIACEYRRAESSTKRHTRTRPVVHFFGIIELPLDEEAADSTSTSTAATTTTEVVDDLLATLLAGPPKKPEPAPKAEEDELKSNKFRQQLDAVRKTFGLPDEANEGHSVISPDDLVKYFDQVDTAPESDASEVDEEDSNLHAIDFQTFLEQLATASPTPEELTTASDETELNMDEEFTRARRFWLRVGDESESAIRAADRRLSLQSSSGNSDESYNRRLDKHDLYRLGWLENMKPSSTRPAREEVEGSAKKRYETVVDFEALPGQKIYRNGWLGSGKPSPSWEEAARAPVVDETAENWYRRREELKAIPGHEHSYNWLRNGNPSVSGEEAARTSYEGVEETAEKRYDSIIEPTARIPYGAVDESSEKRDELAESSSEETNFMRYF